MKKTPIIFMILFFLMILLGVMLFYTFYYIQGSETIVLEYEVAEKLGINTDTDKLNFGKGMPGTQTKRDLKINNTHDFPISVLIKISGPLKPFITVSKNNFLLDSGETTVVTYFVKTTKETSLGNYTGMTTLIYTRPVFK